MRGDYRSNEFVRLWGEWGSLMEYLRVFDLLNQAVPLHRRCLVDRLRHVVGRIDGVLDELIETADILDTALDNDADAALDGEAVADEYSLTTTEGRGNDDEYQQLHLGRIPGPQGGGSSCG